MRPATISVEHVLLLPVATLSVAAGGIYFAVIAEHLTEFEPYAVLFLLLGWFQVLWPIPYVLLRRAWLGWLAVAINAGAVSVWLWSRATGLPFGPEANVPELAGPLDLSATGFEVVLAGLLVALSILSTRTLLRAWRMRALAGWAGALAWSAIIVAIASVALLSQPPDHGHGIARSECRARSASVSQASAPRPDHPPSTVSMPSATCCCRRSTTCP